MPRAITSASAVVTRIAMLLTRGFACVPELLGRGREFHVLFSPEPGREIFLSALHGMGLRRGNRGAANILYF